MATKRKSNRVVVVLLSDTHAGHKLGLMHPEVVLLDEHDQEYTPGQTETQRYLWELYQKYRGNVADLADGCPVVVIHNGDLTQGFRYGEHLVTPRKADQIRIAVKNLTEWYRDKRLHLAAFRVLVGSEAHTFGEGSAEVLVADQLRALFPAVPIRALYHLLYEVQGDIIDVAHHGPFPGSRTHLRGNSGRAYVRDLMTAELLDGNKPARIVARAHYHEYLRETVRADANGKEYVADLLVTPSFSGIDDYVRRATKSKRKIDHGLIALEFDGGLRDIYPLYQQLEIRTKEAL